MRSKVPRRPKNNSKKKSSKCKRKRLNGNARLLLNRKWKGSLSKRSKNASRLKTRPKRKKKTWRRPTKRKRKKKLDWSPSR